MSNEPTTVTYSLEDVLLRLEQKIDHRLEQLEQKIDHLQQDTSDIKVGQARLEEKVDGLSQRVGTVEKKCESIENGQKAVVNDVSDLKGAKALIVPIVVATLTSLLTLIIRAIPNP